MWVVKFGGSLDGAGTLKTWLDVLVDCDVPLIICPGGGLFADQVRAAHRRWPIDDASAHRMAILAMEQTAYLLCGLGAGFNRLSRLESLREPGADRQPSVWFPAAELIDDPEIPCTWDITSDSLAAVLAQRIGADGLVLIKSVPLPAGTASVGSLQRGGVLDASFHLYGGRCGCPVWLLSGAADSRSFRELTIEGDGGVRVLFD